MTSKPFLILAVKGSSRAGLVAACRRRDEQALVDELAGKTRVITAARGFRASLPLSRQTLNSAAGIIRRHRISIGSLRRKLNPGQQALLALAYLRNGETSASLEAGFGVGTALPGGTRRRRSRCSPHGRRGCARRPRDAARAGHAYAVLDGTLIPIDRVAADRPFYSGKHKRHGMNLQVIVGPVGTSSGSPERVLQLREV